MLQKQMGICSNLWDLTEGRFPGSYWKITKRRHQDYKFWLNCPNRILSEGKPEWSGNKSGEWGTWQDTKAEGGRFFPNWLCCILAKPGLCRSDKNDAKIEGWPRRRLWRAWVNFSEGESFPMSDRSLEWLSVCTDCRLGVNRGS